VRQRISSGSKFEDYAGYCRAVADGRWVFVSGTVGPDADGSFPADAGKQARNAIAIIDRALTEAGSSLADVVRVRVYLAKRDYLEAVAPILGETFGDNRPTNTTVVSELVMPEMLVEIEVTALKPEG
jgi:enamine deaminase RidA (YjgF/YER057c/UK114 family)